MSERSIVPFVRVVVLAVLFSPLISCGGFEEEGTEQNSTNTRAPTKTAPSGEVSQSPTTVSPTMVSPSWAEEPGQSTTVEETVARNLEKFTLEEARTKVANLREVEAFSKLARRQQEEQRESVSIDAVTPWPVGVAGKNYWVVEVRKNVQEPVTNDAGTTDTITRTTIFERFLVGLTDGEILVSDLLETDAYMTLKEWRRQEQPMKSLREALRTTPEVD